METQTGAEYISEVHVRHIMRYVQARDWIDNDPFCILDAACGTGYGTKLLAQTFPLALGVDFDLEAIKEASKTTSSSYNFMQADLLEGSFHGDCIVSMETIEHFSKEDGEKLVANFSKWLPIKGLLIISTPYCSQSGPSPITKQHLWEYSLTDFEHLISGAGFAIDQIKVDRHEGQAGRLGYCMVKAIKR